MLTEMAGKARPGSGVAINLKLVLLCAAAGLFVLYLLYSYITATAGAHTVSHVHSLSTWKTVDFVDIPADVHAGAKEVKIEERHLSFDFNGKKMEVFFLEVNGGLKKGVPVLLLHGAASSSAVWKGLGTLQLLGQMGIRAVALDLPGYGASKDERVMKGQTHTFLARFIEQEHLDRPIIVSPSMSGAFSIPYLMTPTPQTCQDRARAFVPLAPVHTEEYSHAQYHRCEIPVLIVYGTKDKTLGLTSVGNLRNMPNREIFPMEGAGHANYQERPEEWHRLFYNFLLAVEKE